MHSCTYRIDDRARRVPREPRSRGLAVTLFALTFLARPASARWLGGTQMASGGTVGESRQGNTRIVQETAGMPVATQIAYDTGSSDPPEAPVSAEDVSDEVRAHARRLSETLRSSITPELTSALGEGIAPGRPEPHVRGRSLAEIGICDWVQQDADYDYAYQCALRASVVNDFKPETVKGRTGFDVLKPIVTCLDIEDKDECQMKPSCIWYPAGGRYAEDTCDGDFNSILTAPVPANDCAEDEQVDETIHSLYAREIFACQKYPTESECNNAAGLSCSWDPNESGGSCTLDSTTFLLDLIRNSEKELHLIVALGRQADTCAVKTTQSDCDTVAACSWTSATSLCDVADSTVKSIVGVETLAGVFSTWNTCQIKSQSQCNSDGNCEWSNGNCEITNSKAGEMLVDGMADGAFKTFISDGVPCTNSRATDGTTSTVSNYACQLSSTLAGHCFVDDTFYHLVDGKYECFYWPNDPSWSNDILYAPYPGYGKRCPNVYEQYTTKYTVCAAANSEAECGTGDYEDCTWEEGSCGFDDIWKIILGDADGANLNSIIGDCGSQTNETACGAFESDIDFFSLRYPNETKVKATLSFSGLNTMNAETVAKVQAAVATAVGGDVDGGEIAITGVQFPVESKIELSISKSAVDADLSAFETKFKKGLAEDLGVLPSDIVIKFVQDASSRRRRTLLSSHVEIDYEVNGAPDAVRAQTIANTVQSSGGLNALKSSTDTTATVPTGTTPTYALQVAVEPKTSDPNGVAARLDSATITVDGVTATHITHASDDLEKKDDDTFMFGLTTLVFALLCAGVVLLVAVLVCCVAVKMRRGSSSKVASLR